MPRLSCGCRARWACRRLTACALVDFLTSLPDVDPKRIGVTGASGGGTQTFILCSVDERPAAQFPAVMVSTAMQGGCVCENCAYLRVGTGNVELAGLFAPKPLGMVGANDWTKELETKGLPELKALYGLYGKPDLVAATVYKQFPHNYNGASGMLVNKWFSKYLQICPEDAVKEGLCITLLPKELSVYDAQHPRPADEKNVTALRASMSQASEKQLAALAPHDPASLKEFRKVVGTALRVLAGGALPGVSEVAAKKISREDRDGVRWQKLILERASNDWKTPALWLQKGDKPQFVVVWVDPKGKASLVEDGKLVKPAKDILGNNGAILAIDVLGIGEWTPRMALPIKERIGVLTFGYNLPLVSQRVQDILSAVACARQHDAKVRLAGFGEAGPWVLLAAGLCGDAVDRTAADASHFRFDNIQKMDDPMMLPGAVKFGGLGGFAALAAPHNLLVFNNQDEKGAGLLKAAFEAAGAPTGLELGSDARSPDEIVAWLVK